MVARRTLDPGIVIAPVHRRLQNPAVRIDLQLGHPRDHSGYHRLDGFPPQRPPVVARRRQHQHSVLAEYLERREVGALSLRVPGGIAPERRLGARIVLREMLLYHRRERPRRHVLGPQLGKHVKHPPDDLPKHRRRVSRKVHPHRDRKFRHPLDSRVGDVYLGPETLEYRLARPIQPNPVHYPSVDPFLRLALDDRQIRLRQPLQVFSRRVFLIADHPLVLDNLQQPRRLNVKLPVVRPNILPPDILVPLQRHRHVAPHIRYPVALARRVQVPDDPLPRRPAINDRRITPQSNPRMSLVENGLLDELYLVEKYPRRLHRHQLANVLLNVQRQKYNLHVNPRAVRRRNPYPMVRWPCPLDLAILPANPLLKPERPGFHGGFREIAVRVPHDQPPRPPHTVRPRRLLIGQPPHLHHAARRSATANWTLTNAHRIVVPKEFLQNRPVRLIGEKLRHHPPPSP